MFTVLADAMYRDMLKKALCSPSKRHDCRSRRMKKELDGYRHLW